MKKKLTVTGASTRCTFDSSNKISLAFEHKLFTSLSVIISQRLNCSICLSRSEFVQPVTTGSVVNIDSDSFTDDDVIDDVVVVVVDDDNDEVVVVEDEDDDDDVVVGDLFAAFLCCNFFM